MGVENFNPHEELARLDEQIESAAGLAELKAIFFRLNGIVQAFPGDFDIQLTGNEIKQRLMARGSLLKQQAMPAAQPSALTLSFLDTVAPAPGAAPESSVMPAATPLPPPENPPQPPARPPASRPAPQRPNRAMVIGPIAVLTLVLLLVVLVLHQKRKGNTNNVAPTRAAVQVDLATTPPGASMRVAPEGSAAGGANQATCTSNCKLALKPGGYQVTATLNGY